MSEIAPSDDIVELAHTAVRDAGRPLLFVHGFSHNRHVWTRLAEILGPGIRPLLIDLRGHGDSGWSIESHYAPEDYARDLPMLLDSLDLNRVILVGHSLGGHAATLFAAAHPERVEGLVLVDTGPGLSLAALSRIASDTDDSVGSFESIAAYGSWLSTLLPLSDPRALADFAAQSVVQRLDGRFELKVDPGALMPRGDAEAWRASARRIESATRAISCPTLLVRGGLSAVLPKLAAEEICGTMLAHGSLHTLERAGHAVMLDDGPGLGQAIEQFVGTLPTAF